MSTDQLQKDLLQIERSFREGQKTFKASGIFKSDEKVLADFLLILQMRRSIRESLDSLENPKREKEFVRLEKECTKRFHSRLGESRDHCVLPGILASRRYSRLEREVLLVMICSEFNGQGLNRWLNTQTVGGIAQALERNQNLGLSVLRALDPERPLVQQELIEVEEEDYPSGPRPRIGPILLEGMVRRGSPMEGAWPVKHYEAFLEKSGSLIRYLSQYSQDVCVGLAHGAKMDDDVRRSRRMVRRHLDRFERTLGEHPEWPLNEALGRLFEDEICIVLVLLGKELGYLEPGDHVFTGRGLAMAVSKNYQDIRRAMGRIKSFGALRRRKMIDVCGGLPDAVSNEDDATLENCEFELTDAFLEKIQVKRRRKSDESARPPMVRLDQLVLSEQTRFAIDTALAQARNQEVLFDHWGLGSVMPYGRGITLLFNGPPGTGKTSAAEGIAHALDQQIIVVNYAEVQNKFVGETEKRIMRAFRSAAEMKAVLFWDEADAMFYDRDTARAAWEARDVNVLLQEVERFRGVCILATNRRASLDKALERRITLKIEFPRPDRNIRRAIWKKMVPKSLPLEREVEWEALSRHDLSGGDIKNVVLNAARIAVRRGPDSRVSPEDFAQAVRMENSVKNKQGRGIGFF